MAAVLVAVALQGDGKLSLLDTEQKQKIEAAIQYAEKQTSGEFVAVIATASDDYFYIPTLWAALLALAVPSVFAVFELGMENMILVQLMTFIVVSLVSRWQPLKMKLIPKDVKQRRARRHAHEQFFMQNLHHTELRNGIMMFVSEAEHYVEIIADKGINDVVENGTWENIVADFVAHIKAGQTTEGYLAAIDKIEALLKMHFPVSEADKNELPNRLIEVGLPESD